jgi:hypothetical protein
MYAENRLPEPASVDFIRWPHREFYRDAPEEMLRIAGAGREFVMAPGEWRSRPEHDVAVGRHLPPSSERKRLSCATVLAVIARSPCDEAIQGPRAVAPGLLASLAMTDSELAPLYLGVALTLAFASLTHFRKAYPRSIVGLHPARRRLIHMFSGATTPK